MKHTFKISLIALGWILCGQKFLFAGSGSLNVSVGLPSSLGNPVVEVSPSDSDSPSRLQQTESNREEEVKSQKSNNDRSKNIPEIVMPVPMNNKYQGGPRE